ncbi:hypothetical protein J7K50_08595 [bacterium]|nr:hypothetical protein [bacterium]
MFAKHVFPRRAAAVRAGRIQGVCAKGNDEANEAKDRANDLPRHIGPAEFYVRTRLIERMIRCNIPEPFHCLFAVKRSGWVVGVQLSHYLDLPIFAKSEVNSLPDKFRRILIVDTVSWTGRSLRRSHSLLKKAGIDDVAAAVLFANAKHNPGDMLHTLVGDMCDSIPVFFFNSKFEYSHSHEAEYGKAALELESGK